VEIINLVDVKKVYLLLYNITKFTSLVYVYKALRNISADYEKGNQPARKNERNQLMSYNYYNSCDCDRWLATRARFAERCFLTVSYSSSISSAAAV
jgi:hypothetical protein